MGPPSPLCVYITEYTIILQYISLKTQNFNWDSMFGFFGPSIFSQICQNSLILFLSAKTIHLESILLKYDYFSKVADIYPYTWHMYKCKSASQNPSIA